MVFGSMPRDGGHLIISDLNERNKIVEGNPDLSRLLRDISAVKSISKINHDMCFG